MSDQSASGPAVAPSDSDFATRNAHARARLMEHAERGSRTRLGQEIGRGGFSQVRIVEDLLLRRTSARKLLERPETLYRFVEEAQVTAQLSHPGVVAVHDLGLDDQGRAFIDMTLVVGRQLTEAFELARAGDEGWTTARALDAVLKVCQTVAHAHDRGVVHRDLKPDNILVGAYGDVYVMDWGLARVLAGPADAYLPLPELDRAVDVASAHTLDGQTLGTPFYMPPEQARGDLALLDRRADVYAVGAILYHLCAGRPPYQPADRPISSAGVLQAIALGPPEALERSAPEVAPELAAIVTRAMERAPEDRYPDLGALEADLRAFLEHRVVRAYQTGPWAEARKWVRRNRGLSGALAAALVLLVVGLATAVVLGADARRERDNVLRLAAMQDLEQHIAAADELWPPSPVLIPELEAWLARAELLVAGLWPDPRSGDSGHVARWRALRERAEPGMREPSTSAHPRTAELVAARAAPATGDEAARSHLQRLEVQTELRVPVRFASATDNWWHARVEDLIDALCEFAHPETGLFDGTALHPVTGPSVARRLTLARELAGSSTRPDVVARWHEALEAVRTNPLYGGLVLEPDPELVPLGPDPLSGLYEFWHRLSGEEPILRADGTRGLDHGSGLVLVLIPGGRCWIGAQRDDQDGRNFDPDAEPSFETPPHEVSVGAFFLSKFELTQAQWLRWHARNPSNFEAGRPFHDVLLSDLHPVEQVSADDAREACRRLGLRLPTELEWEHAARAGSGLAHGVDQVASSLGRHANVADSSFKTKNPLPGYTYADFDDGWVGTAPVGSLAPSPWGVYDIFGNIFEWCEPAPTLPGRLALDVGTEVLRGGSWCQPPQYARVANRWRVAPGFVRYETGVRPARSIGARSTLDPAGRRAR